jgi:4-diphosphocytidyl-2C-methyl-D-erythritol kinase
MGVGGISSRSFDAPKHGPNWSVNEWPRSALLTRLKKELNFLAFWRAGVATIISGSGTTVFFIMLNNLYNKLYTEI